MKKFVAVLMAVLMMISAFAMAETVDVSGLSDTELQAIIDAANAELAGRSAAPADDGKTILFEQDNVQVYLTGNYEVWGSDTHYLDLQAVVVNDTDVPITVSVEMCSVNGWGVYASGIYTTNPGKKQKDDLSINISDAEISTFEEVEEVEFQFKVYNSDTYDDMFKTDTITLTFND